MILILDTHNFLHRSRVGLQSEFSVIYNFIRSLRSLIATLKPTRVLLVLEGHPQHRYDLLPEYKGNRVIADGDTAKRSVMDSFHRQKNLVLQLLGNFPVTLMKHSRFECDDTIYNVIKNSARSTEYTVVSNDTDFIQLLQEFPNVKLYNPMKKTYVTPPEYDYILWKALRGDGSDNIPGLPGIGDKRAIDLASSPDKLKEFLDKNPQHRESLARNLTLIKLYGWNDEEATECVSNSPTKDWVTVQAKFEEWGFTSLLKEPAWSKLVETFDKLWT